MISIPANKKKMFQLKQTNNLEKSLRGLLFPFTKPRLTDCPYGSNSLGTSQALFFGLHRPRRLRECLRGVGEGQVAREGCFHTSDFTPGYCLTRTRLGEQFSKKNFRTSDPEERCGAQETGPNDIRGNGP